MGKNITINVNGEDKIIDLENVEECEKYSIKVGKVDGDCNDGFGKIQNKIIAITPLLATAAYLLLGFIWNLWHPGWLVFLIIPIVPILFGMFNGATKSIINGLTFFICVATYLVLGIVWGLWHPYWIIFFLIPIVAILTGNNNN